MTMGCGSHLGCQSDGKLSAAPELIPHFGGRGQGRSSNFVQGGSYRQAAFLQHMCIDHGGLDIFMAEEFLHGADIVSILKQVGGEGVAEGVATDGFVGDASQVCCSAHSFL